MKRITINDSLKFEMEDSGQGLSINGETATVDLQQLSKDDFHILLNNFSYSAEFVSVDRKRKEAVVKVNGTIYNVSLSDEYDELLKDLGMETADKADAGILNAPMPGLVLHLLVKPGDILKKGDGFLVLEAMKMENLIKAQADLRISSVEINEGDKVEKNQILLRYDSLS